MIIIPNIAGKKTKPSFVGSITGFESASSSWAGTTWTATNTITIPPVERGGKLFVVNFGQCPGAGSLIFNMRNDSSWFTRIIRYQNSSYDHAVFSLDLTPNPGYQNMNVYRDMSASSNPYAFVQSTCTAVVYQDVGEVEAYLPASNTTAPYVTVPSDSTCLVAGAWQYIWTLLAANSTVFNRAGSDGIVQNSIAISEVAATQQTSFGTVQTSGNAFLSVLTLLPV